MNFNSTPPLPSFHYLFSHVTVDGLIGYLCGKLSQMNPILTATIVAIRALANTLFYEIAHYVLGGENLKSQKIFLVTSTATNMTFLVVLRQLNVIGQLSSYLLGLAVVGYLTCQVRYIQKEERELILKNEA